ncbi:hypothetical protein BDK51DRAFT_35907 [Blyttiomyces helicus]|uniref:mitochondrial intermediate peptidase n=1 Tax=Blyttiomyces helicus TaxID=388810 RepID=A0A4P9WHW5_9FUNG|nr:hypothetical protein BDK51DRAFT_35907 [Blyttiomyces helicus]|eukprot:RKO91028.1 hypothetical protein BDK51DRAFT_35907 [Blyttiomyces helicus]
MLPENVNAILALLARRLDPIGLGSGSFEAALTVDERTVGLNVRRDVGEVVDGGKVGTATLRNVGPATGLFGYTALSSPAGFVKAAHAAASEVARLADLVCTARDPADVRRTVKRLDRLSDVLCSVVDAAELVRNVHPDPKHVDAANEAHSILSSLLNQLNTHQGLYAALVRVFETPSILSSLSTEELRVAQLLKADFEKSGIHLPDASRRRFVELSDRILNLGHRMVLSAHPSVDSVTIDDPHTKLQGLSRPLIESMTGRTGRRAVVRTGSSSAFAVLRMARDEAVRKSVYVANNSGSEEQIGRLEEMLVVRGQLAQMLGKESFAELSLGDKMVESPENVMAFLESLAEAHQPKVLEEISRLQELKRIHTNHKGPAPPVINAWDRYYYGQFISPGAAIAPPGSTDPFHSTPSPASATRDSLASYFTTGATFEGLSTLFSSLYGVTFRPAQVAPGETWHEDVRKLEVVHETEGLLGIIYCDLFIRERDGGGPPARKYECPAHFTVGCLRRIDDDEVENRQGADELLRASRFKQVKVGNEVRTYQLPVVVLVTSFMRPEGETRPGLLSLSEVETLFHEMGHAMHSVLARTNFQHIAGTRVPMDFVEVPSTLMEYFARSPAVLSTFARHYQTGDPLPPALLAARRPQYSPLETHNQLQMALLDQQYHSRIALSPTFSSTQTLRDLHTRMGGGIPFAEGTAWQVQFSHLFSYGASYYSYFWSRRWVLRIWRELFEGREGNWREGGEKVREELLAHGGGRDPWVGLERVGVVREGEREGRVKGRLEDLGY